MLIRKKPSFKDGNDGSNELVGRRMKVYTFTSFRSIKIVDFVSRSMIFN